ncbi:hypothetical protein F5144DRAFT_591224 [Chaetomium tenue]|uniref:Uncharacterized protein n=1 Tax=Chaetomium tenue TaxID=1854479 RepID=A0ACB7PC90_9PEZI|nr:hypothetical protein F5144DRAFT_591224 [Chaetomium globosum]
MSAKITTQLGEAVPPTLRHPVIVHMGSSWEIAATREVWRDFASMVPLLKPEHTEEAALSDCIESLITQWQTCLQELLHLQQTSEEARRPVRGLNALLKTQQRALEKTTLKQRSPSKPAISQAQFSGIKSCCWEDRWSVVKKCRGLIAINKDFPRSPRLPVAPDAGWLAYKDQPFQERPVSVDAVVDSGATWVKFVSISSKTLEYQVVAEGWASEPEDEDGDGEGDADEGLGHTEFADTVKKIIRAARWNHCHHVHLVLPGLQEGTSESVDRMIRYVRDKIGGADVSVRVSCAGSAFLTETPPPLETAISALIEDRDPLVSDDCGRLTETVNLDPSVLVALVTDLHHGPVPLQPEAQQHIIARSLLDHETDNNELVARQDILPTVLYPALRGRQLVCTRSAVAYFRKLIAAIATHSEETRASFILPPDSDSAPDPSNPNPTPSPDPNPTPTTRLTALQTWSTTTLPPDLHLPIRIVPDITLSDIPPLIASGTLPPMALPLARDLSPLNRAVYCYGWAHRLSTVTGHRGIERQVRLGLGRYWERGGDDGEGEGGGGGDEVPPDIWHRHLGGYLVHRDKPKDWRAMVPGGEDGEGVVPWEVERWTNPWTTWGRGISTYGLPDTRTWEGVGHGEKTAYGRKVARREAKAVAEGEEEDEEQS